MAISLQKGGNISLSKTTPNLKNVTIGLGWDARSTSGDDFDLDASIFMVGAMAKCAQIVISFFTVSFGAHAVRSSTRATTGPATVDGDDEQIIVRLNDLHARYESSHLRGVDLSGKEKGQSFGKVSNAFIRAVDARGKEICRYNISGDASYSQYRSMTFAQVSRQGGAWEFRAIGTPHETDRFVDVLKNYI